MAFLEYSLQVQSDSLYQLYFDTVCVVLALCRSLTWQLAKHHTAVRSLSFLQRDGGEN